MRRFPRRIVHASCVDVGGKLGQSYAYNYVKRILKNKFCRGTEKILVKEKLAVTEGRRQRLRDVASEECRRFLPRSRLSRSRLPFSFQGAFGCVLQRSYFFKFLFT